MSATGGGKSTPELTPLDTQIAAILREASVCGIVSEKEGDTDLAETTDEPGKALLYLLLHDCVNNLDTCGKNTVG